jgi:hypothetical protein
LGGRLDDLDDHQSCHRARRRHHRRQEHSFGAFGHAVVGALGGALSGYFLQVRVIAVVDFNGDVRLPSDQVTQWFVLAIAGLVAGAILVMAAGLAKHMVEHHRRGKT